LAGWLAGIAATIPFELGVTQRYVDGNTGSLAGTFVEGMLVWSGFTFLLALAAWIPLVLPIVLLVPPRWLLKSRWFLVPGSAVLAVWAMARRLQILHATSFVDWATFEEYFIIAPIIFAVVFAAIMTAVYLKLVAGKLSTAQGGI
jgi:hypothetical protein